MERLFEGEHATSPRRHGRSNSYQLFERCATAVSTILRTFGLVRIAVVLGQHLYSPSGRHSSAVEQLFRKSPALCAVLQAWRADTNGHTYQLFVSRDARLGSSLRPVLRPGPP